MEFNNCSRPTVGVEWELQLVDARTLDLFDGILPLMEFFPDSDHVKPEFIQSCVELTSCVAGTSGAAIRHVGRSLAKTNTAQGDLNAGERQVDRVLSDRDGTAVERCQPRVDLSRHIVDGPPPADFQDHDDSDRGGKHDQ